MARRCELTGKGVLSGHNVSHANNKTKRKFRPNLSEVALISDKLDRTVRLRISKQALRSLDHNGGLDTFITKQTDDKLSDRALRLKREFDPERLWSYYQEIEPELYRFPAVDPSSLRARVEHARTVGHELDRGIDR